jgi:hypothetical protein
MAWALPRPGSSTADASAAASAAKDKAAAEEEASGNAAAAGTAAAAAAAFAPRRTSHRSVAVAAEPAAAALPAEPEVGEDDDDDDDDKQPVAKKAKKTYYVKRAPALYNKVVAVRDLPPCYPANYWFVYQYVPDMEWCHLCPLYVDGTFKTGPRAGAPRYKLCPEGRAREIDVPASRCTLVEARQCVHSASADKEVFDIPGAVAPAE